MKGFFVYMFLNESEEVLYIGYSINLVNRIETQHFLSARGNLTEECILETKKVLYHNAVSADDMKVKERYLINSLTPKYNCKLNNNSKFSFSIDIEWKLYSLDTSTLIEKRNKLGKKSNAIINHNLILSHLTSRFNAVYQYVKINYEHKKSFFVIDLSKFVGKIENLKIVNKKLFFFLINEDYYIINLKECFGYNDLTNENYLNIDLRDCNQYYDEGLLNNELLKEWDMDFSPTFGILYEYLKEGCFFGIELNQFIDNQLNHLKIIDSKNIKFTSLKTKQIKNYYLDMMKVNNLHIRKEIKAKMKYNYINLVDREASVYLGEIIVSNSKFIMINMKLYIYSSHLFQWLFNKSDIKRFNLRKEDYVEVLIEGDSSFLVPIDFGFCDENELKYELMSKTFFSYDVVKNLNLLSKDLCEFFDRELSDLDII